MSKAKIVRCLTPIIIILLNAAVVRAQAIKGSEDPEWARNLLVDKDQLHINFKSVAKGQEVSFKIRLKNIFIPFSIITDRIET